MEFSQNGVALLKKLEGYRKYPYLDEAGYWTIGYGTRIAHGADGKFTIPQATEEEAEKLLLERVAPKVTEINHLVSTKLTQNQFDALVIFIYNVGEEAFAKSTMLKLINAGDFTGAASQFDRWVYDGGRPSDGLKHRRAAEKELFNGRT